MKKISWRDNLSIPNLLTLLRLIAIPFMAYIILDTRGRTVQGFWIFIAIWLTDALDGWIARRFNQITPLGKVLDPLVDKIFHLTTAVTLHMSERLPLWVLLFLLIKDALLIIGGILLINKDVDFQAEMPGKIATVLFAAAFASLFLIETNQQIIVHLLFIPAAIMAIISFLVYLRSFLRIYPTLKNKEYEADT